jgi:hypothetical protein
MQVKQWFTLSAIALATGAALAGQPDGSAPLTRAEVRQSVLAARAAGELQPAGEAEEYPRPEASTPSTLTRSQVRQEVLAARASGQLIPAGEGDEEFFARSESNTGSLLTRADVKAATRQARDAGELIPAGEGDDTMLARERAQDKYARTAWLAHTHTPAVGQ